MIMMSYAPKASKKRQTCGNSITNYYKWALQWVQFIINKSSYICFFLFCKPKQYSNHLKQCGYKRGDTESHIVGQTKYLPFFLRHFLSPGFVETRLGIQPTYQDLEIGIQLQLTLGIPLWKTVVNLALLSRLLVEPVCG